MVTMAIFVIMAALTPLVVATDLAPILHLQHPNEADSYVFAGCGAASLALPCRGITDNNNLVLAITQAVNTITERFPEETCYCLLEKSHSKVSCICGNGSQHDGLLADSNQPPAWTVAETLWQPQYGFVSPDPVPADIASKEDLKMTIPEDFELSTLVNCEGSCVNSTTIYTHDQCVASCKAGNAEKVKVSWKSDQQRTIKHLSDVSHQISAARSSLTSLAEKGKGDASADDKRAKKQSNDATRLWISNLMSQRSTLMAHLSSATEGFTKAAGAQLYWITEMGKIENTKRAAEMKASEDAKHATFLKEQMAHLDDEVIKEKAREAEEALLVLRRQYVDMTASELVDPVGDEAYHFVVMDAGEKKKGLEDSLASARTQLAGIQSVILKKGTSESTMKMFNDYSKQVASLSGELLKYSSPVVESAALSAKLTIQKSTWMKMIALKNQALLKGDAKKAKELEDEEGAMAFGIRQTQARIVRLVGSSVPDETPCDTSLQCGSVQVCRNFTCNALESGTACEASSDCGNGQLCVSSICSSIVDGSPCDDTIAGANSCGNGMVCMRGQCSSLYPQGGSLVNANSLCEDTSDCGLNQFCLIGKCVFAGYGLPCGDSTQCGNGAHCSSLAGNNTACLVVPEQSSCRSHEQCGLNQLCQDSMCTTGYGLVRGSNIPQGAACDSGYDCGISQYCKNGVCVLRELHSKCKPAWAPGNGQLCKDGFYFSIPEGTPCESQEKDCGGRQVCHSDGICRAAFGVVHGIRHPSGSHCYMNEDCGTSQMCSQGRCIQVQLNYPCSMTSAHCGNSQKCVDGLCVLNAETAYCKSDGDCGASEKCIQSKCRAIYGFSKGSLVEEHSLCSRSGECGFGQRCNQGSCVGVPANTLCELGCGNGQSCFRLTCTNIPVGSPCSEDGHCGSNQACQGKKCKSMYGTPLNIEDGGQACTADAECDVGQSCAGLKCTVVEGGMPCDSAVQCGNGQRCFNSTCIIVPHESQCRGDDECGKEQICASDSKCHGVYGLKSKICPKPLGDAMIDGATARLEYCMALVRGTPVYDSIKNSLLDQGAAHLNPQNVLVASVGIEEICAAKSGGAESEGSFLEVEDETVVVSAAGDISAAVDALVKPVISITPPRRRSSEGTLMELRDSVDNHVTFYSLGATALQHHRQAEGGDQGLTSFLFPSDGRSGFVGTSPIPTGPLTLLAVVNLPSQGCLLRVRDSLSIAFDGEQRVVVQYTSVDKKEELYFASEPVRISHPSGAVFIALKWDDVSGDVSVFTISPDSQWKLQAVRLQEVRSNREGINTRSGFSEKVRGIPTVGGVCLNSDSEGDSSLLHLSYLTVYDELLRDDGIVADFITSVLSRDFLSSSLHFECDEGSDSFDDSSIMTDKVVLSYWKWKQLSRSLYCTPDQSSSPFNPLLQSVDTFALEEMRERVEKELIFLVKVALQGVSLQRFSTSSASVTRKTHSEKALMSKVFSASRQKAFHTLLNTGIECICDDTAWQTIEEARIVSSNCHAHLLGDSYAGSSCKVSHQCPEFMKCAAFACTPVAEGAVCESMEDCGNGMACAHGHCSIIPDGRVCASTSECGVSQICLENSCRHAFGSDRGPASLRQLIIAMELAQSKLRRTMEERETKVGEEAAQALINLQTQRQALIAKRKSIEERIAGEEALRRGKILSEYEALQAELKSYQERLDALEMHKKNEREKALAEDEKMLAALDYESTVRESMEKQLIKLQDMIDRLKYESEVAPFSENTISNNSSRTTNCCGSIGGKDPLWEIERKIGFLRGAPSVNGTVDDADREAAEIALCRANVTASKTILHNERERLEVERRRWEEAVVRLARPKTCHQLLGLATGGGDGLYTIFPPEHDEARRYYGGVQVYCDMTTDGGGWTLVGYAVEGKLGSELVVANGDYEPEKRDNTANVNALWVVQASSEASFSWTVDYSNGKNTIPTGGIGSYQTAVKFDIPNPTAQTLVKNPGKRECTNAFFSPVTVECLVGVCNLPSTMYTGTDSLTVCTGHAYGLASSDAKDGMCDWRIGVDEYTVQGQVTGVYLGIDDTAGCSGVADKTTTQTGGGKTKLAPSTMAMWVR